ncbi:MAG: twin-arginine translocase TatA/TatE family subunit [Thermomicrobiales bacterium]
MFGLGAPELIVTLVIVLVLFGGKKLPELSKSIGQALKDIRGGLADDLPAKSPADKERE